MHQLTIRPQKKRRDRYPLVLIIDEEESVRALLHRVLETEGCAVIDASGVAEAIALLEGRPDAVDLVIADISEPGVRGPGGLMQRLAPATKVLLLSIGTNAPESSGGGDPMLFLLHRPFRSNALRDKVRELLGEFRPRDQENLREL
jgi:two-component system OmpR family response regulator